MAPKSPPETPQKNAILDKKDKRVVLGHFHERTDSNSNNQFLLLLGPILPEGFNRAYNSGDIYELSGSWSLKELFFTRGSLVPCFIFKIQLFDKK